MINKFLEIITESYGTRLDKVLFENFPYWDKSHIKKLIINGLIGILDKKSKASTKIKAGDKIYVTEEAEYILNTYKVETKASPEKLIDIVDVLYEDSDLLIVDKPSGVVTHHGKNNTSNTLMDIIISMYPEQEHIYRAGIVHRLDKGTSGLILIARNEAAADILKLSIQNRDIKRIYHAVVWGSISRPETVNKPLSKAYSRNIIMRIDPENGREATTIIRPIIHSEFASLIECELVTGRTHQIRAHLKHLGHGIIGDRTYKANHKNYDIGYSIQRQALHAKFISLKHPINDIIISKDSKYPKDILEVLKELRDHIKR